MKWITHTEHRTVNTALCQYLLHAPKMFDNGLVRKSTKQARNRNWTGSTWSVNLKRVKWKKRPIQKNCQWLSRDCQRHAELLSNFWCMCNLYLGGVSVWGQTVKCQSLFIIQHENRRGFQDSHPGRAYSHSSAQERCLSEELVAICLVHLSIIVFKFALKLQHKLCANSLRPI